MDDIQVFSQDLLTVITLLVSGAGDGVAKVSTKCEMGLSLCSLPTTALSGEKSDPRLLEKKP